MLVFSAFVAPLRVQASVGTGTACDAACSQDSMPRADALHARASAAAAAAEESGAPAPLAVSVSAHICDPMAAAARTTYLSPGCGRVPRLHCCLQAAGAAAVAATGGAGTATSAAWAPTYICVSVNDSQYFRFDVPWASVKDLDVYALAEAMSASRRAGVLLSGVSPSYCKVYLVKGAWSKGMPAPTADDEQPGKLLQVGPIDTLDEAVQCAGCSGDALYIKLVAPPTKCECTQQACRCSAAVRPATTPSYGACE